MLWKRNGFPFYFLRGALGIGLFFSFEIPVIQQEQGFFFFPEEYYKSGSSVTRENVGSCGGEK